MAPPRMPYLVDKLVGEILLRLPSAEPADLLRTSLVCKRWRCLLTDPAFRRQYREFHRTPPLLGFFHDMYEYEFGGVPRFVPAVASPCSPPEIVCSSCCVLDCRHGRVLIHAFRPTDLVVWDPITRGQQRVPLPPFPHAYYTGSVLCAVDGCDHLDCRGGPFLVVFVGTDDEDGVTRASIYSSETGAWGASISIVLQSHIDQCPSLLIGDALYFMVDEGRSILRYDLAGRQLSEIDVPHEEYDEMPTVVMLEDGRLGFTGMYDWSLYLFSWQEAGSQGTEGWNEWRVIDLETLLPVPHTSFLLLSGFMEGTNSIFLSTDAGVFGVQLASGRVTKISENGPHSAIIPYTGFYTP